MFILGRYKGLCSQAFRLNEFKHSNYSNGFREGEHYQVCKHTKLCSSFICYNLYHHNHTSFCRLYHIIILIYISIFGNFARRLSDLWQFVYIEHLVSFLLSVMLLKLIAPKMHIEFYVQMI